MKILLNSARASRKKRGGKMLVSTLEVIPEWDTLAYHEHQTEKKTHPTSKLNEEKIP